MSDLISRADALGELNGACSNWEDDAKVAEIINALPSAEIPTESTNTPTNTPTDLISRADAIRWVKTECNPYGKPTLDYDSGLKVIEHLKKMPSELPSAEAEQVTGKLKNPCDSLLKSDSDECKEQKSKLDLISREDAIEAVHEYYQKRFTEDSKWDADAKMFVLEDKTIAKDNMEICNIINAIPSADVVSREMREPTEEERASVKRYIDSISADVVAVVRCKDCRYRNGKVNRKGFEVCDATGMDITDNDFCSWGERR